MTIRRTGPLAATAALLLAIATPAPGAPGAPVLAPPDAPDGPTRLLRRPSMSAAHIAFEYGNDIWVVGRAGGAATRITSFQGQETRPSFSPDGEQVVFSWDGGKGGFLADQHDAQALGLADLAVVEVHAAAQPSHDLAASRPFDDFDVNAGGTLNLLDLCRARGVGKFILASTSSLYGKDNDVPYSEDANTNRPLSPYAASKKAAEALCYTYHHLYGIDVTVYRYFTVFGPSGRPDMSIFRFIQWVSEERPVLIYGDGQQSRDFTFVANAVQANLLAARAEGIEEIVARDSGAAIVASAASVCRRA